jgi:hypothetical protein
MFKTCDTSIDLSLLGSTNSEIGFRFGILEGRYSYILSISAVEEPPPISIPNFYPSFSIYSDCPLGNGVLPK